MCGRFTLTSTPELLARRFGLEEPPSELVPRFNIAPNQDVATIRAREDGTRVLEMRRWGLVPAWARDPKIGNRMINARSETVSEKPAFREAYRRRRCLVPADGFYEWRKLGKVKQPYRITLADGGPFAFAGLWERWRAPDGQAVSSFTIITTEANPLLRPIHDRMPVILDPADYDAWLDTAGVGPDQAARRLRPYPDAGLVAVPVSTRVNSPKNDDAACIVPLEDHAAAG